LAKAIVNACTRWGVGLYKESNPYGVDEITEAPVMTAAMPAMTVETPTMPTFDPGPVPVQPPITATPPPSPYAIETTGSVVMESTTAAPAVIPAPATASMPIMPIPTVVVAAPVSQLPEVSVPTPMPPVKPPAPVAVAAPPVAETTTTFAPPLMPEQPVAANIGIVQTEMPKIPAPMVDTVPSPTPPSMPFANNDDGLGGIGISDVQKVALNGILTMNNAEYTPLAQEAFAANGINKEVPARESLNYEEAVIVIKFGNEKFRKNR